MHCKNNKPLPTWLRFFIVILLVLGVFFRFSNLERQIYWGDEAATSLRISGYTWAEVIQQVYDGHLTPIEELRKYQHTNPEKGLQDTVRSLAIEDSQHPPLYYVIAWFWVKWVGSSAAQMRSLSALISLLAFPCMYWLCQELFESPSVGWIAMGLLAVSLLHVMYAQEAREFSLWTVTILLSSAALLRAMRLNSQLSWGIYGGTLTAGLYTFPLTGLVAIGQGIYVLFMERFRLNKTLIAYLIASLLALLLFTPWLLGIANHVSTVHETTSWMAQKNSLFFLGESWNKNISHTFLSFNKYLSLLILSLIAYSIYFLVYQAEHSVRLFILILILLPALSLILPDLILGGRRSTIDRYLLPCYLGIQLVVAYLLSSKITTSALSSWRRKLWQIILILLLILGVKTCIKFSQAEFWINKDDYDNISIAQIINQSPAPLIISDQSSHGSICSLLSLTHLLDADVQFQLIVAPNIPKIPEGFSTVFLYVPSEELRSKLEQEENRNSVLMHKGDKTLWKLDKI